jgi:hypothetical protein
MKKKLLIFPLIMMGLLGTLLISCSKDTETATISDENFYKEIGIALIDCYTDIYNQNLAGAATGTQNISTYGPLGGTVLITGSTSYDNTHGITTTDLVFSMNDVKYTYTFTDTDSKTWVTKVTLSGATTYTGSFSDSYTSINHQSDNLYIKGSVTYEGIVRNIDMSGVVNINRSTEISVNIFGNTVTW